MESGVIDLIARFSPRLRAARLLFLEIDLVFRSVEALLHDRSDETNVQVVRNEISDVRRRIRAMRGE